MVPFTATANGQMQGEWSFGKSLERETKHCSLVSLVEIPLDIQAETTGRPRIYEVGSER